MVRNMSSLTREIKEKAIASGFASVGITSPDNMRSLPYGWIGKVKKLREPEEIYPDVKSVVLLVFHVWDQAFFTQIESPKWRGYGLHPPEEEFESYYYANEVMENRARRIADHLRTKGYNATITRDIPLKTTAVRCGLGSQGKSTLLITPILGPRVNLISVLTNAPLETDEPHIYDPCRDCERCVKACPTKALEPYKLNINRCLTYSAETPCTTDVPQDVRELDKKLIKRPTTHTYIECSICMDVCPIGKNLE